MGRAKTPTVGTTRSRAEIRASYIGSWDELSDDNHYRNIEMVSVDILMEYREFDRELDTQYHADMIEHIKKNGIKSPIILSYDHTDGVLHIAEGNHRVKIAKQLGVKEIPARVTRSSRRPCEDDFSPFGSPRGYISDDEFGHVPADIKPSEIGLINR